eukprot:scaffold22642_cov134-Cylindrotheca_fusiformis.AAC.23
MCTYERASLGSDCSSSNNNSRIDHKRKTSTMSPAAVIRSSVVRSAATRSVARRQMSTEPKMHKASDKWNELLAKRPPKDEIDTHLCFHPPYNGPAVIAGLVVAFVAGYGAMGFGMVHQQKKQGFW